MKIFFFAVLSLATICYYMRKFPLSTITPYFAKCNVFSLELQQYISSRIDNASVWELTSRGPETEERET